MKTTWILDVGNTRTKLAVFNDGELTLLLADDEAWEHAQSVPLDDNAPSVLVAATGEITEDWKRWIDLWSDSPHPERLIHIQSASDVPTHMTYESPETLGLDRLANAFAVTALEANTPWLILDLGTCITADFVQDGHFCGGSIAPGIDLRLKSMYAGTAHLPYLKNWREQAEKGIALHLGTNTESSLLAGALGGVHAEIQQRIRAFQSEFPELRVVLTGGDAKYLELHDDLSIFADASLTWKGYYHLHNRIINHDPASK